MSKDGDLYSCLTNGYCLDGIRPAINLRKDVEFTGDGSFKDPYVIKTN